MIVNLITGAKGDEKEEAALLASIKGLETLSDQSVRELGPHEIRVYTVDEAEDKIVERVLSLITLEEP